MKTIVFSTQKGGSSKTSSSYALAVGLHNKGYTVLIVDADPQGNLTYTAGIDEADTNTLYDVFKGNCQVSQAIRNIKTGLDLLTVGL